MMTAGSVVPALAVTIDWVPVINAGNAADTTGYGDVSYDFSIAKYETTLGNWADFLNAVAATDTYGLYNASMGTDQQIAGITRSGVSGSYTYAVFGPSGTAPAGASSPANRPITYVSWFDAARFANWMQNGQPTGAQGSSTTETGAYLLNGAVSGTTIGRTPGAQYYVPTENEWYKAAYYSPVKNGPSSPGYYQYPTQSDLAPGNALGSGSNQANYRPVSSGSTYSVTQSATPAANQNYLSDVGAFTASQSYYGAFDMAGNAREWNSLTGAGSATTATGARGGSWDTIDVSDMQSTTRRTPTANGSNFSIGFRLTNTVVVPEPSTYCMALAGLAFSGYSMFRRRKRA